MTKQISVFIAALALTTSSVTVNAQNIRRYFSEGRLCDTLLLTNSDKADISLRTAIEVRASVPRAKEGNRPWHEGFGVQIATTDSSYTRVMLYPANTDYGYVSDQWGMQLKVWNQVNDKDTEIYSHILTDNIGNGRDENTLSVEAHRDGRVTVYAGKRNLEEVYEFNLPNATKGERFAVFCGDIDVSLLVDEYRPDISATLQTKWSLNELDEYFALHRLHLKPAEGYWQYLDQDTDESYAHAGGRYRVALVDNGDGGYDIIYHSGAVVLKNQWHCGMYKGSLTPTIFPGNYDLRWIDSEMRSVNREAYATLEEDGQLLTLSFPTLKSSLRLCRVPWDN